jgi:hypothetical protein
VKKILVLLLSAILMGLPCQTAHADSGKEKAAEAAARAWLSLVDEGKYAESWTEAATFFKGAVTQESWIQSMKSYRQPLGENRSRKRTSSKYARTLPGAPDGEYVVIQYRSSFEKKQSAVETITPMLDKDGKWRVSGYYIR